jgi:hypothetical protein
VVALVPFSFIFLLRGWNATFRSGDAFIYLCGLTVGAIFENLLQLLDEGVIASFTLAELWSLLGKRDTRRALAPTAILFGLGVWYAIKQPHVRHPTTSWVQITIFFLAIVWLSSVRFRGTRWDDQLSCTRSSAVGV